MLSLDSWVSVDESETQNSRCSPSAAKSAWINEPSGNSPSKIRIASGSCTSRWINRFRGRAPYCGSYPRFARKFRADSLSSIRSRRSDNLSRRCSSRISRICAICSSRSEWKITTSSIRFKNSGDYPLHHVRVVDNLTPRLELVPGSGSSDREGTLQTEDNSEGSLVLTFELEQPLEPRGQGFIEFQVKLR